MEKRSRVMYMDWLRLFAALSVVVIHAVNPVAFSYSGVSHGNWLVSDILSVLGRSSVPLFVMLSGALLLDPSRRQEADKVMFRRRLVRIGLVFVVWSIVYFLWRAYGLHESLTPIIIFKSVLAGTPGEHLYFLPLIAGLYAITPLLRVVVWSLPLKRVTGYTIMLLGLAAVWQLLSSLPGGGASYNLLNQFVPFIGYYLLGYVLAQHKAPLSAAIAWTVYACGVIVPVAVTFFLLSHPWIGIKPYYMYDFINPFIMLQAVGAWMLGRRYSYAVVRRLPVLEPVVRFLSGATLSLYLVHLLVLQFIATYVIHFQAVQRPLDYMAILIFGGLPAALLVAILLAKTPFIKKAVT